MSELCMGTIACDEQRETAKDTILSLAAILTEIKNQVDMIDSAMYGTGLEATTTTAKEERPMLMMLRQQRDFAENILQSILHIRDGLW